LVSGVLTAVIAAPWAPAAVTWYSVPSLGRLLMTAVTGRPVNTMGGLVGVFSFVVLVCDWAESELLLTVTTNDRLKVFTPPVVPAPSSVTVTVTVSVPAWPAARE